MYINGYRTDTFFGRNSTLFEFLKSHIHEEGPLKGLVVGAGLSTDMFLKEYNRQVLGFGPERMFSWEYVELAGMLSKGSNVTIVDACGDVCEAIAGQKAVPMHDFNKLTDYVHYFTSVFDSESAQPELLDEINNHLKRRGLVNRVSSFARIKTPEVELVNQDFNSGSIDLRQYHVITMLESARYMNADYRIAGKLKDLLYDNGFLLVSSGSMSIRPDWFTGNGLMELYKSVDEGVELDEINPYWAGIYQKP